MTIKGDRIPAELPNPRPFSRKDLKLSYSTSSIRTIDKHALRLPTLEALLDIGLPVLIDNIVFQEDWSPSQFAKDQGTRKVTIQDCENPAIEKTILLKDFLSWFSQSSHPTPWRLKVRVLLTLLFRNLMLSLRIGHPGPTLSKLTQLSTTIFLRPYLYQTTLHRLVYSILHLGFPK